MLSEGDAVSPDDIRDLTDQEIRTYWLKQLRDAIRTVWTLPELRSKRWAVHKILEQFLNRGDKRFNFVPMGESYADAFLDTLGPPSRLEQILEALVAERSHHLARICRNSDCPYPYYFADRKTRKFCSDMCALPAVRESKRKSWKKTGSRNRSERIAVEKQRRAVGQGEEKVRQPKKIELVE
jgi:hypothetical protein